MTEDQLETPDGMLAKPPIALMRNSGRIFGLVLAVGDAPRHCDRPWPELDFGDLVELSRHTQGAWYKRAVWALFGEPGQEARRVFAPEDGGPERFALTNDHLAAFMRPGDAIGRWARREWVFGRRGSMNALPHPVGERVLVRNQPVPELSPGGILLPHWMRRDEPLGEVVAAGWEVDDLAPGDWVLMRTDRGTRIESGGEVYTCLRRGDIALRWDGVPSEDERLRYGAEIVGVVK